MTFKKALAYITVPAFAFTMLGSLATPALAADDVQDTGNTGITITSSATVSNSVGAYSNTGSNAAIGGMAGRGARGGNAGSLTLNGSGDTAGTRSGNGGAGGAGGNGGAGGRIVTGDATTGVLIENAVNVSDIRLHRDSCGCPDGDDTGTTTDADNVDDVTVNGNDSVKVDVAADLTNDVEVMADTGANVLAGGEGADGEQGGNGGAVTQSEGSDLDNPTSGNGGAGGLGGHGGRGGVIRTGSSESVVGIANLVNSTIARIHRR